MKGMTKIDRRKRIDYTKEKKMIPAVYFDERPQEAVHFVRKVPVVYDGVKENTYWVDTEGNIYNNSGLKLSTYTVNSGYQVCKLITGLKNPKYKNALVHRVVMTSFNPINNSSEMTVNHINTNPDDNSLDNLEWTTQKENNSKMYESLPTDGTSNYQSAFSYDQLATIVDALDKGFKYKEILSMIGMDPTDNNCDYIGNIKRGRTYKKEVAEIRQSRFND